MGEGGRESLSASEHKEGKRAAARMKEDKDAETQKGREELLKGRTLWEGGMDLEPVGGMEGWLEGRF